MPTLLGENGSVSALEAYELLAAYYDDLTSAYAHGTWVGAIETELRARGLGGPRVLDVACGTGKSSLPWIERGYHVTACDISPAMVQRARERLDLPAGRVCVADIRTLEAGGSHDIVTCLDDSLNYVLDDSGRRAALERMAAALRPGGALVFDCNSVSLYRDRFVGEWESAINGRLFSWKGRRDPSVHPDAGFRADLEVWDGDAHGRRSVARTVHRQRHHDEAAIRADLEAAGLILRARLGQASGARLSDVADEEEHPKVLHLAQRIDPKAEGGSPWSSTPNP